MKEVFVEREREEESDGRNNPRVRSPLQMQEALQRQLLGADAKREEKKKRVS